MKETVPNQKIYDDIIKFSHIEESSESTRKLLRNKFAFLMDHVFFRKREDYKQGTKAVVPMNEAAIVRNLLYKAITPAEDNLIYEWFNNADFSNPYKIVMLFEQIVIEVEKAVNTGETDSVTADECLQAISASLNYGGARYTIYLNQEMNTFRLDTLAMNSTISFGDIVTEYEDGEREYLVRGNRTNVNLEEKTLEQAIQCAANQDDYLNIIAQVIKKCAVDAENKTKERLIQFLLMAKAFDVSSAADAINDDQVSSEYIIWYQKIHDYLVQHPDILQYVEQKSGFSDATSFFQMSPTIDFFCKNCRKSLKVSYRSTGDINSKVLLNKSIACMQCKRVIRLKGYTERMVSKTSVDGKWYI